MTADKSEVLQGHARSDDSENSPRSGPRARIWDGAAYRADQRTGVETERGHCVHLAVRASAAGLDRFRLGLPLAFTGTALLKRPNFPQQLGRGDSDLTSLPAAHYLLAAPNHHG
jgi:hypothetical protein